MRFWQFQHHARSDTRRLLAWFAVAVLLMVPAVHIALALPWWLLAVLTPLGDRLPFPAGFLFTNVAVVTLFIVGGAWLETSNLRDGGVKLAKRVGAREIRPTTSHAEQRLNNIVAELCIAANMPQPKVMVVPRVDMINAFAAGWNSTDAVVAVTQGALDYLTREEMQGLVAHELSHIYEGDTRLKMRLAGMVYGLELIYNFGDTLRTTRHPAAWWAGSVLMVVGWAGWMAGKVLKASVSRQREHLADARAVQWTRSKDGLGGVLRKVMGQYKAIPSGYEVHTHKGLNHPSVEAMLVVDMVSHERVKEWLQTHPPLLDRVRRVYGCHMPPMTPVILPNVANPDQPTSSGASAKASIGSVVDPFVRYL